MRKLLQDLWWLVCDFLADGPDHSYPSGTDPAHVPYHRKLTCPGCGASFQWLEGSGLVYCPYCTRVYDRSHPDINVQLR